MSYKYKKYGSRWRIFLSAALAAGMLLTGPATPVYAFSGTGATAVNTTGVAEFWHYTVNFDLNADSGSKASGKPDSIDADTAKGFTLPSAKPTREGYDFLGWSRTKQDPHARTGQKQSNNFSAKAEYDSGKNYKEPLTTEHGGSVTLYAVWRPHTYSVKFNANISDPQGEAMPDETFVYDESGLLSNDTWYKDGWTLQGWSLEKKDEGKYSDSDIRFTNMQRIVHNMTSEDKKVINLYGVWKNGAVRADDLTINELEHTHHFVSTYNNDYHWEYCDVCGMIQGTGTNKKMADGSTQEVDGVTDVSKASAAWKNAHKHNLTDNGGGKDRHDASYGASGEYRLVCRDCGWQSGPLFVLHGNPENYTNAKRYVKDGANVSLTDDSELYHITRAQFDQFYGGKKDVTGNPYIFWQNMPDGRGLVLNGVAVLGDPANGVKGTIETCTGSEGTVGLDSEGFRGRAFVELYKLVEFHAKNPNGTRTQFVNSLSDDLNTRSNSHLKGLKTKYRDKVTDGQFNNLMSHMVGLSVHTGSYGWGPHNIMCAGCDNPGASYAWDYDGECYDSAKNQHREHNAGPDREGTCDVCGYHWNGTEEWYLTWFTGTPWSAVIGKPDGTQSNASYDIYGGPYNSIKLGTVTVTYAVHNGGQLYADGITAKAENGVTVTMTDKPSFPYKLETTTMTNGRSWYYPLGHANFTYTYNGKSYTKVVSCGLDRPHPEYIAPKIGNVTQTPLKSVNVDGKTWTLSESISVSGTEDSCTTVNVRLFDPSNGNKQVGETHMAHVDSSTRKWSVSFVPDVEGPDSGHVYRLEVTDLYGNKATTNVIVRNVDTVAPELIGSYNWKGQWAQSRDVTIKVRETGSGNVKIGVNDVADMARAGVENDGATYYRTYHFTGNVYEDTPYTIHVQDAVGNSAEYAMNIGLLDSVAPSIHTVDINGRSVTVTADDINLLMPSKKYPKGTPGSGVDHYGYIDVEKLDPSVKDISKAVVNAGKSNTFTLPHAGRFLIVAYDKAGNMSDGFNIEVEDGGAAPAKAKQSYLSTNWGGVLNEDEVTEDAE